MDVISECYAMILVRLTLIEEDDVRDRVFKQFANFIRPKTVSPILHFVFDSHG